MHTYFVDEMSFEVLRHALWVAISLIVAERTELRNSRGETDGGPEAEPEGSDILMTLFQLEAIGSAGVYQWMSVGKKLARSTRTLPT